MTHWADPPPTPDWVPRRVPRLTTAVVIALLIGAVIVTVTLVRQKEQTDSFADPILSLCHEGGDTADKLTGAGLCGKAAVAKTDQVAAAPAELSDTQADQVQALVQQELAKRRAPAPVGPTTAQLTAAVQAFVSANPTLFKAPAPTAEQIQTAVNSYMRTHPVEQSAPTLAPYVNPPFPGPQYQMPGLGGFSGAPGDVWQQPWPSPRGRAVR